MNLNRRVIAAVTLGLVCFVLTIAIFVQVKTTNTSNSTVAQTMEENDLRDQVLRMKEKYDNVYEELGNATKRLEQIRVDATKDDSEAKEKQKELSLNNMLLCQTDVTGEGIIITLKDGTTNSSDILSSSLMATDVIVHNSDLLQVVNDLKNAGAEAISINGERIVQTSSITCEGIIIKINNKKLGSPYVIKAIGSAATLETSLNIPGGYLERMKDDGVIVDVKKSEGLTVKKYEGIITTKYLKNDTLTFSGNMVINQTEKTLIQVMPDTKKITIPKSVKWIEPAAFKNTSIKTLKVSKKNKYFAVHKRCLYRKAEKELVYVFGKGSTLTLSKKIKQISEDVVVTKTKLKKLIISHKVKRYNNWKKPFVKNNKKIKIYYRGKRVK